MYVVFKLLGCQVIIQIADTVNIFIRSPRETPLDAQNCAMNGRLQSEMRRQFGLFYLVVSLLSKTRQRCAPRTVLAAFYRVSLPLFSSYIYKWSFRCFTSHGSWDFLCIFIDPFLSAIIWKSQNSRSAIWRWVYEPLRKYFGKFRCVHILEPGLRNKLPSSIALTI